MPTDMPPVVIGDLFILINLLEEKLRIDVYIVFYFMQSSHML